jgi:hypothetical protein
VGTSQATPKAIAQISLLNIYLPRLRTGMSSALISGSGSAIHPPRRCSADSPRRSGGRLPYEADLLVIADRGRRDTGAPCGLADLHSSKLTPSSTLERQALDLQVDISSERGQWSRMADSRLPVALRPGARFPAGGGSASRRACWLRAASSARVFARWTHAMAEIPHGQICLRVVRSAIAIASARRFQLAVSSPRRARPVTVSL